VAIGYCIVVTDDRDDLEKQVEELRQDGLKLAGGVSIAAYVNERVSEFEPIILYAQALVEAEPTGE